MVKKGSALLLVLLLAALPGCGRGGKKQRDEYGRGRTVVQKADDFNTVNLALADELDIDPDQRKAFLNELNEFVSLGGDFELSESAIKDDEFAWEPTGDKEPLKTVYFGFNQSKVAADQRSKVAQNVDKAKQLLSDAGSDAKLVIEGHACASAGSDAYNMGLSQRRAKEVSDQLITAGLPRNQVKTVGRGVEMLIVKEGGQEEQAINRRVEMHVIRS